MSEEILINVTPSETRVAIVENGVLQEVHIERSSKRGLVSNIYHGKVCRILPGMQAAFIDIGLERSAFLHASDIRTLPGNDSEHNEKQIRSLLHDGQELLVQVIKDPLGTKGARLTTHISIPSRYLVLIPNTTDIGISHQIENEKERLRLKKIIQSAATENRHGYIVRTAAEGSDTKDLLADMDFLNRLWKKVQERIQNATVGMMVYEGFPLAMRTMRDMVNQDIDRIRIDSRETHQRAAHFAQTFLPEIADRVQHYPGERPIFDIYSIEDEIQKALERQVQLKSGGYLVIDQTEAMTTIDVNTGAFVGHKNLSETIFKTNLEATHAVARQLRLRNLGGIIIIDFIDMTDEKHKQQVLQALERHMANSHSKYNISTVSALGLVEMTRKRTRESLEHILCETCPTCNGRGSVKTAETTCYDIFREIMREARQFDAREYLVLACPEVVDRLIDEESTRVAELEEFINKPVKFQIEATYTQEQFDIILL
ncbi:MAG TPA: ribonuclease G [Gammaproteobacteria bacterium]|nr:ribonuclease G [Gammaproteobacteria bacterium]